MAVEIDSSVLQKAASGVGDSFSDVLHVKKIFTSMLDDLSSEWTTTGGKDTIESIKTFITDESPEGLDGYIKYIREVSDELEQVIKLAKSIE